jgi:aspartyl-tRNA(Asn)/glutamyl-tRNA(Gln) amidotransferase subunit C
MTTQKPDASFSIDEAMVKHVAFLVRLGLEEEEAKAFSDQFSSIIDYFHLLKEVDTRNVAPACETSSTRGVMRPDEVLAGMPRDDFMENVPQREGDFVHVPQVFGDE